MNEIVSLSSQHKQFYEGSQQSFEAYLSSSPARQKQKVCVDYHICNLTALKVYLFLNYIYTEDWEIFALESFV